MSFVNLYVALIDDIFFLNPNWLLESILFVMRWSINLLYIILSKILENEGNKEIGIKFETLFLSPFLYKGIMIEYISLIGNTPVGKGLFII
jgi:hypothetical protein